MKTVRVKVDCQYLMPWGLDVLKAGQVLVDLPDDWPYTPSGGLGTKKLKKQAKADLERLFVITDTGSDELVSEAPKIGTFDYFESVSPEQMLSDVGWGIAIAKNYIAKFGEVEWPVLDVTTEDKGKSQFVEAFIGHRNSVLVKPVE